MKDYFNLRKSKLLLFMLLTAFAGGVSPAWADAYTETFNDLTASSFKTAYANTDDAKQWYVIDGTIDAYGIGSYTIGTEKKRSGNGIYTSNSPNTAFLVTPKMTGNVTIYFGRYSKSAGYVEIYEATESGTTFTKGSTLLTDKITYPSVSSSTTTFSQITVSLGSEGKRLAIVMARACMDDFSGELYASSTPVTGPQLVVKDGSTTIASPYAFDFGLATPGTSHTFTLNNPGTTDLGVSVSETGSFGAQLSGTTIAAGGSVDLTITMPATSGSSDITITPAEGSKIDPFVINASATVAANFAITPNTAQFLGMALPNAVVKKDFTITNSGNAPLEITFTDDEEFYASIVSFTRPKDASWGNDIYIYAWDANETPLLGSWPGKLVTESEVNDMGETVYTARLPHNTFGIIFHDNTGDAHKTRDIKSGVGDDPVFKQIMGIYLADKDKNKPTFWKNENFTVPAGGSANLTVRMASATAGAKSGEIALAFTASNATSSTINVSGYVADNTKFFEDFSGNALPDGWSGGSGWTFSDGNAHANSSSSMILPAMTIAEGENMAISVMPTSSISSSLYYYTSTDGGETWSTKSSDLTSGITTNTYSIVYIEGVAAGNYMVKLEGSYVYIDAVNGFTKNENAPKLGRYSDESCTVAVAKSVTKEFGFVTAAPDEATKYYLKNDGTGTMTLSLGEVPTGFTASLDKTSVTAGDKATLTINIDATKKGYHDGSIVVTAAGLSDFTVAVSGVVVDKNKLNLNFASDNIPATWTAGDWSKSASGYIEAGFSGATLETSTLTAVAGEQLVVVAKNTYTTSSYTFGVKYKKVGAEEWSDPDLIVAENQGTSYKILVGTIAEAGDYLLQFNGKYAQIQRIYGLTEPEVPAMIVYDGENKAGDSYVFVKATDEAAVSHDFIVKNEGKAPLTGLAVVLGGTNADDYTAVIVDSKTELAASESATITVTQKAIVGSHSATLTISATGLDSKVIALSGETTDHTILDIDFATSGVWPAEILEHDGWNVNWGTANQPSTTASSMIITPLMVSAATDKFNFKVQYYSSSQSSKRDLVINYTTDGGLTWTPYNWGTESEPVTSLKSQITSNLKNFEITNIPAGTVAFDFNGQYISVDDITGDYKTTKAPLVSFTTVSDNISGANLSADGVATYTLANKGNAAYVGNVTATNVTVEVTGDDVTFENNTLTIPAGKTATITATMAFAAPYGDKTGKLEITSESWVGDITADYNATLVDPTDFVEDFANGKPAGWYNGGWTISGGDAHVYTGTAKELITEKLGVESGKNVLSFDAKVYTGSDNQTLNVYTSTDRKTWSVAYAFTLTSDVQSFSFTALAADSYVKFEASNASIDNLTGVKKLDAPAHDLYQIGEATQPATGVPGASCTASMTAVSLRADETMIAELWLKKGEYYHKVASLENEAMTVDVNKTFTLTGNLPAEEGEYKMWITIKNSDNSAYINTDETDFTIAHTRTMDITNFENAPAAQANDNNEFEGTFTVTVQNTGSKSLAADEVSVTLIDYDDAESTFTKTLADVLFIETSNGTEDIAIDAKLGVWMWGASSGEWAEFTKVRDGFWCVDLKGNTGYIIVRQNPAKDFSLDDYYNKTDDIAFADGNLRSFSSYNGADMIFNAGTFALTNNQTIPVKVTVSGTLTDGEDASFNFKAKENVSNTFYGSGLTRSVNITAAPVIELDEAVGTIASTGANRKVTLNRTFVEGWNTICLPFAVTDLDVFGEGTTAYEFSEYAGGEIKFTAVNALAAGTPYLMNVPAAKTDAISFTGVTVISEAPAITKGGITFQGTYAGIAAADMDASRYSVTTMGNLKAGDEKHALKGFRAYFTGINSTARLNIVEGDGQGIAGVVADGVLNTEVYNLNGQRVETMKKGQLYIINGKKQVVK